MLHNPKFNPPINSFPVNSDLQLWKVWMNDKVINPAQRRELKFRHINVTRSSWYFVALHKKSWDRTKIVILQRQIIVQENRV